MAFKMKSGNGTSFKQMGSSPMKIAPIVAALAPMAIDMAGKAMKGKDEDSPTPQKVYGGGYTDETDPKEAQREKERTESLKLQEAAKAAGKGAVKGAASAMELLGVTNEDSGLKDLQPGMDPDHAHPIKQKKKGDKHGPIEKGTYPNNVQDQSSVQEDEKGLFTTGMEGGYHTESDTTRYPAGMQTWKGELKEGDLIDETAHEAYGGVDVDSNPPAGEGQKATGERKVYDKESGTYKPLKQTTTTTKYNKKGIGKRGKTITYTKESGTDKRGNDKGVSKKITKTDGAGNEYNIYAGKGGNKPISSKRAARQMNRQDRRVNRGKQTKTESTLKPRT